MENNRQSDLITIIVPVYNVELYVEECLNSIINQTYKNLEIIVIDDGSTDKSGIICDEYKKRDNRITVVHKKNGGVSEARNAGLDLMQGAWVVFVDSDDFISTDHVELLHNLCGKYNTILAQGCPLSLGEIKQEIDAECTSKSFFLSNKYIATAWGKIFAKELFSDIRFPVGKIHEDDAIIYKLVYMAERVAYTNKRIYFSHIHEDSLLNSPFNITRLAKIDFVEEKINYFMSHNEEELADLAFKEYINVLLNYYYLTKKNIGKKACKNIFNEYKQIFCKAMRLSSVSLKFKFILIVSRIFPCFFGWVNKVRGKFKIIKTVDL